MVKSLLTSIVIYLALFSFGFCASQSEDDSAKESKEYGDVYLTTALGRIRGTYLTSSSGRLFYAFRGIRYVQPPIGDLRFKPPKPINQWNGIFDATKDGPMCPQPTNNLTDVSEDCLRLNIYTHALPSEANGNVRKPVIVYLHPGGFYAFSGQSWNYAGPLYLMDRNIVLVTVNYRLGSLGFLSTGTPEAPGNNGLKDQVAALQWIKLHIAKFGGNPDSVTLLGYSAGAVSTALHMISPMSKNLFHRAIVMSGSPTDPMEFPSQQLKTAKHQARLLNCSDEFVREMMKCLMMKDGQEFGTSLGQMLEYEFGQPVPIFKPVVEPDFGQERFLIDDPVKLFQRGRFMKIPVIAGITKDELVGMAIHTLKNYTRRSQLDQNFDIWAPVDFLFENNGKRSNDEFENLRDYYLGDNPLSVQGSFDGLGKLYSDALVGFSMYRFVHLAARFTRVYQYRFSYQGRYSHSYYPKDDTPSGVVHQDDLLYIFNGPHIAPLFTENDPERITVERLTRMFAAFAYKGDPNKPTDDFLRNIRWRPFGYRREPYLDIGENLVMREHLYNDRYNMWKELYPLEWGPNRRNRLQNSSREIFDD